MDFNQATELMQRPLDGKRFNSVAAWLRVADSSERMTFLRQHFPSKNSHRLAISTVNNRREAMEFLRLGLDSILEPNSSSTKAIAKFGILKVGARRTISEIASRIETQPHVVDMALYWLPSLIPDDAGGREELEELTRRANALGIIRPVRRIVDASGRVTYADRYGP